MNQIAQYDSGAGEGGTEILAYDEKLKRAFVTNGAKMEWTFYHLKNWNLVSSQ